MIDEENDALAGAEPATGYPEDTGGIPLEAFEEDEDYVLPEIDEYEMALGVYSDAHKDAYGFRPRGWEAIRNRLPTVEAVWEAIQDLQPIIDHAIETERAEQAQAWNEWNQRIRAMANFHNITLGTAVRWDFQAENCEIQDAGYYCYLQGLSYSKEDEILEMYKRG